MSAKKRKIDRLSFDIGRIYQEDFKESVDTSVLYSTFLLHQNPGELFLRRHSRNISRLFPKRVTWFPATR